MTKIRKNVLGARLCLVALLVGVCALAACGSKDLSVTFTVEGKTQTVEVVDGKVNMPADPEKEFYEFRGWYTTPTFEEGTEFTKDTEVKENMTVYAYFAPIHVDISVGGATPTDIKLEDLAAKTEEYAAEAKKQNLTFDGWYIDAAYGTKYVSQDADALYGRYAAEVVFDNGYEVLKTELVGVGSSVKAPDKESENFVPYYMDKEDLSYAYENGEAVDFSSLVVNENTKIKVLWKSPYINYQKIDGTANDYAVTGFDFKSQKSEEWENIQRFPAISFLSENVTINGVKGCNVVAADFGLSGGISNAGPDNCISAVYASFAEGIKYINRFQACTKLETVSLPSTLKVLERSFWNMRNLKAIELPEGLEAIIDSFWGDYMEGYMGYYRNASFYDFVTVPASVKTLITVPSNLKFEAGSEYYYEEGELYRDRVINGATYKTLVTTYQAKVVNDTITVKEGVEAVSVGAFRGMEVKYISLPSTFKLISYASDENNETYELSYYTGSSFTDMQRVLAPDDSAAIDSFSVYSNLCKSDFEYLYVNQKAMPEGVSEYAFTNNRDPYTDLRDDDYKSVEKVVFIGKIARGEDVVIHITGDDVRDASAKRIYSLAGKKSGDELTAAEVLEAVGITAEEYTYEITDLGGEFSEGMIESNKYLKVSYMLNVLGFTYTADDANKIITVTGFDQSTAKDLGGVYRINIDFLNDPKYADYTIVIAKDAFNGNNYISEVYVGAQVTEIGESAFANTANLTKFIVSDGGLSIIRKYAFLNAGCTVDGENVTINPAIKRKGVNMTIPLANLTVIEPYAFKSKGIITFTSTVKEKDRSNGGISATSTVGEYFFVQSMGGDNYGIVKYVDGSKTQTMKDNENNDATITVYDVQYVATAGGFNDGSGHMGIGQSNRYYGYSWAQYVPAYARFQSFVYRYEVMEGSVYYLGKAFNYISFGIFTKIHTNAFTDMEEERYAIYNNIDFDIWMDAELVKNQDSSLFEEGWFEGRNNSENEFMKNLLDHEDNYL